MNKGIQRIAIIVSVAGVVIGAPYLLVNIMDHDLIEETNITGYRYRNCMDRLTDMRDDVKCEALLKADIEAYHRPTFYDEVGKALAETGALLTLGWLALWIVTSLTAWVYRGFRGA
jgi:hypothetical protein